MAAKKKNQLCRHKKVRCIKIEIVVLNCNNISRNHWRGLAQNKVHVSTFLL